MVWDSPRPVGEELGVRVKPQTIAIALISLSKAILHK